MLGSYAKRQALGPALGSLPPTWAQASVLPTQNLRGGVGFRNLQQSLTCFLTRGDTEASSLDSQDIQTT